MSDLEKQFITTLKSIETERRLSRVFFDFVELSAIAVANSVDKAQFDGREERYMAIIGRYTSEEAQAFKRCFHFLVEIMSAGYGDYLGHLYMSLDMGNSDMGQYFSPYDLSLLLAKAMVTENAIQEQVNGRGFVSLYEPSVGGGGMVIGAAEVMADLGFNPQQQLHVTCQDLDITAVHMTYLQLSLLGIPAVVIHGDTLRMETRSVWYTPFHILHRWDYKLKYGELAPKHEELITKCHEPTTPQQHSQPAPQLALF